MTIRRVAAGLAASLIVLIAADHHQPPRFHCQAERSATVEGVEVIAYPAGMTPTVPGVAVRCPR